jgi:hypothetical protein
MPGADSKEENSSTSVRAKFFYLGMFTLMNLKREGQSRPRLSQEKKVRA